MIPASLSHSVDVAPRTAAAGNARLQSAAHEFEASLMQEFLKPLQHDSLFSDENSSETDDGSGSDGALMSFGSQALAKAISEKGGFGIATKILDHFQASSDSEVLGSTTKF